MNKKMKLFGLPVLYPYIRKYRGLFGRMFVLGVVTSVIDALYPLFNRYALNHFIAYNTLDTFPVFLGLWFALLTVQVIVNYVNVSDCGRMEMYVDRDLRNNAFSRLQILSLSYFNQHSVGHIHSRVMSDTSRIGELIAWNLMDIVWNGAYIISAFAIMWVIRPGLALYIMLLVPVAAAVIAFFQSRLLKLNREVREQNSVITGDINEGITAVKTIKTLAIEENMSREFRDDTRIMYRKSVKTGHYAAMFTASVTFLSSAALAVVLWRGGKLSIDGIMLIGTLSAFMSYALAMLEPIQSIVKVISQMVSCQANIERYDQLMHTQTEVVDRPDVIEKYGDTFHPKTENWEELKGDIEFRDVSFHYPDGEEMVLEHFNLKVARGTTVAIVGETGAGKSTLVNLVCRFFDPTEGQVLIDGKDARDRSLNWLHSKIGYVLQTPVLFSGTIRDNMRYGNTNASDDDIRKALQLVDADQCLNRMKDGLDTRIGEGGASLSTGEKQLFSFARAILSDPDILILDEATASVDTITEKVIQDAIAKIIRGRTSFIIAHRLSTIAEADIIVLVADGKIVESGTHRELMHKKGQYYKLYTRQFEDYSINASEWRKL